MRTARPPPCRRLGAEPPTAVRGHRHERDRGLAAERHHPLEHPPELVVDAGSGRRRAELSVGAYTHAPRGATEPRVATYELPWATVVLAADANDDGTVDWQDGAITHRANMLGQGRPGQHIRTHRLPVRACPAAGHAGRPAGARAREDGAPPSAPAAGPPSSDRNWRRVVRGRVGILMVRTPGVVWGAIRSFFRVRRRVRGQQFLAGPRKAQARVVPRSHCP
ncbi:hypothetical protein [Streptomyces fragilis]|uniref:hypothetical protein n=1 Tax=Streptomyces fragilis TaxID=67301 RepID=UPI001FEAC2D3|nr:hypothetical protein [Streptomyces fragilis]